jgi:hypothetical protein
MGVNMKKGILSLIISSLLLITILLWFFQVREHMNIYLLVFAVGVILVIGFSVYNGVTMIRESKRHLPVEDELSRKNKLRAGYYSYLFSIYLWIRKSQNSLRCGNYGYGSSFSGISSLF